jgi:NAD(P)H-nitrite reductase large subunit
MAPVHHQNQDTNDRFLANIQRNGTFSVIPRIAAGEVTPDGLIAIGHVAKKYGLYTKVNLSPFFSIDADAGSDNGWAAYRHVRCEKG